MPIMNPTDEVFSFKDFEIFSLLTIFNEKLQERIFCAKRSLNISILNNSKVNSRTINNPKLISFIYCPKKIEGINKEDLLDGQ